MMWQMNKDGVRPVRVLDRINEAAERHWYLRLGVSLVTATFKLAIVLMLWLLADGGYAWLEAHVLPIIVAYRTTFGILLAILILTIVEYRNR